MHQARLKWVRRGVDSAKSAVRMMISPAVNFILAYLVIHANGRESWGEFVEILIYTSICSMLISFGIKDYVLRQGTINPTRFGILIKSGLLVRFWLVIPCLIFGSFFFPPSQLIWIGLWLVAMLIYSGIDPLINYQRNYNLAIFAELSFGAVLLLYLAATSFSLSQLVIGFCLATVVRALVLLFSFRKTIGSGSAEFNPQLLLAGFPFLIMGFAGMLQSKTDLYLVSALLGDDELAVYQVTVNLFLYVQAVAAVLVLPFAKNLLRLPLKVIWKLSGKFTVAGSLILVFVLPFIYFITNHIYHFNLSFSVFLVGGAYVLPTFINLPIIYKLIGLKKERVVLRANLIGAALNALVSFPLIGEMGIVGALLGSVAAKGLVSVHYYYLLSRIKKND